MEKRTIITALLASLILVSLVAQASAITGRLGNSRMVLNVAVGEEARRNLLIQNINDDSLTIKIIPTGDLAGNVEIEENDFILQPGEEKKVYFTIKSLEPGTTETKLNVMFKPQQGSGVGLAANVIVIATGDAIGKNPEPVGKPSDELNDTESGTDDPQGNYNSDNSGSFKLSPITILAISTIVLIVIFIILMIYSGKLKRKKRSGRPRD